MGEILVKYFGNHVLELAISNVKEFFAKEKQEYPTKRQLNCHLSADIVNDITRVLTVFPVYTRVSFYAAMHVNPCK